MKNLSLLFIAFLLLNFTTLAQEGWFEQTNGTISNLNAVHFIDDYNGFAVGDNGVFLSTTNGGDSWNIQNIAESYEYLLDVYFTDINNGIVVGYGRLRPYWGLLLHTTDGGVNWIKKAWPWGAIHSVYFIDANMGWAVGNYPLASFIRKTTDGGTTWEFHNIDTTENALYSVYFSDQDTGWVVGAESTIRKTTDGGTTWIPQTIGTTKDLFSVHFIDQNIGWIVGGSDSSGTGIIYKTTDGGTNWTNQPGNFETLHSVQFINQNIGWAVGLAGMIIYTSDGGMNWIPQTSGTIVDALNSVYFVDANTGWAVGLGGTILKTTTGGIVSVEEEFDEIPTAYNLSQNYPNPFNSSSVIRYSVPQSSKVVIKVFDILGREIETLVNEEKPVGSYEVEFDATALPSGIYFYRLQAGDFVETKKMVLMK